MFEYMTENRGTVDLGTDPEKAGYAAATISHTEHRFRRVSQRDLWRHARSLPFPLNIRWLSPAGGAGGGGAAG